MTRLKALLLTVATLVLVLGTFALASFYAAYPEAAPEPTAIIVAAGEALWFASFFLISRLPDKR